MHRLSLNIAGPMGSWSLYSIPAGLDCSSDCHADFGDGTQVFMSLHGGAQGESSPCSPGWIGDGLTPNPLGCANLASCAVTMDQDRAISWAFFDCSKVPNPPPPPPALDLPPVPPPGTHRLTVNSSGPMGTYRLVGRDYNNVMAPNGIDCPNRCAYDFPEGTTVDIEPMYGQSALCNITVDGYLNPSLCMVQMDQDRSVSWNVVKCPGG
jgi:hypothetical protein